MWTWNKLLAQSSSKSTTFYFHKFSLLTGKHFDSKSQLGNYILQFWCRCYNVQFQWPNRWVVVFILHKLWKTNIFVGNLQYQVILLIILGGKNRRKYFYLVEIFVYYLLKLFPIRYFNYDLITRNNCKFLFLWQQKIQFLISQLDHLIKLTDKKIIYFIRVQNTKRKCTMYNIQKILLQFKILQILK